MVVILERQKGYAALVLIVIIFIVLFLSSDIQINIEEKPENDTSTYKGESKTLKELNDFGEVSCDQCIKNCRWTLAKSEEQCQEKCVPDVDCNPKLDVRLR